MLKPICTWIRFLIKFFGLSIFVKIITIPFVNPKKLFRSFLDVFFKVIQQASLPQKPQILIPLSSSFKICVPTWHLITLQITNLLQVKHCFSIFVLFPVSGCSCTAGTAPPENQPLKYREDYGKSINQNYIADPQILIPKSMIDLVSMNFRPILSN